MSEEKQVQADEQAQEENSNDIEQLLDEKVKAAVAEVENHFKSEIKGLNRRNSELEKEIKARDMALKTDEEKQKALEDEIKNAEKRLKDIEILRMKDEALSNSGLPPKFANRITGDNEESISNDAKAFSDYINEIAEKKAQDLLNKKLDGRQPTANQKPTDKQMLRNDFEQMSPMDQMAFMKSGGTLLEN